MSSIPITIGTFQGWAIEMHTAAVRTPSGSVVTRRCRLGDLLYRYGYQGERDLLGEIIAIFTAAISEHFSGERMPDILVLVPPPLSSPRYEPVVALATGLSRATGIASGQFAVKSIEGEFDPVLRTRGKRTFPFSATAAAGIFSGRRVLVIDDLLRTGTSLREFCTLLTESGKAAEMKLLVGTTSPPGPLSHKEKGEIRHGLNSAAKIKLRSEHKRRAGKTRMQPIQPANG